MSDPFDPTAGYDDVEASSGFAGDPLPTGWYYLQVEQVYPPTVTRQGSHQVRMQLRVLEGELQDQRAFVNFTLAPAQFDQQGVERSAEDTRKANANIQAQLKGLLKALGVQTAQAVGEGVERTSSFYSVNSWVGKELVGKIQYVKAREQWDASNRLNAYHHVTDGKKGLSWLRSKGESAASPVAETI